MKQYYIEFSISNRDGYVMQSIWFDTEEQAINWFSTYIDYKTCDISAYLMAENIDGDIIQIREIY